MKGISRLFVRDTPSPDEEPGTNGTPIEPIEIAYDGIWRRGTRERLVYALADAAATVKHQFGIHTMIDHEEVDFETATVTYRGLICWKCEHHEP